MDEARKAMTETQGAEAAQRGYLLTGQSGFLENYHRDAAAALADLALFKSSTADNPSQQLRATILQNLLRQRFAALDRSLKRVPARPIVPSPPFAQALAEGRASMDAFGNSLYAAIGEETGLLRTRV